MTALTKMSHLAQQDRPDEFRWSEVALAVGAAVIVSAMVAGVIVLGWWVWNFSGATLRLAGV
jgi:hypothetical protein